MTFIYAQHYEYQFDLSPRIWYISLSLIQYKHSFKTIVTLSTPPYFIYADSTLPIPYKTNLNFLKWSKPIIDSYLLESYKTSLSPNSHSGEKCLQTWNRMTASFTLGTQGVCKCSHNWHKTIDLDYAVAVSGSIRFLKASCTSHFSYRVYSHGNISLR